MRPCWMFIDMLVWIFPLLWTLSSLIFEAPHKICVAVLSRWVTHVACLVLLHASLWPATLNQLTSLTVDCFWLLCDLSPRFSGNFPFSSQLLKLRGKQGHEEAGAARFLVILLSQPAFLPTCPCSSALLMGLLGGLKGYPLQCSFCLEYAHEGSLWAKQSSRNDLISHWEAPEWVASVFQQRRTRTEAVDGFIASFWA